MEDTKTCQYCKSEMPKAANTCPQCGKVQFGWGMTLLVLFIMSPFILCIVMLLFRF